MIFEITFALAGGINLGLEGSWKKVEDIMRKYPQATWRKMVDYQKGIGKYIVKIS